MSAQLPLTLKYPPDQRFAGFVGQSELRSLVEAAALGNDRGCSRDEWLYLAGPMGSGKTHLLLSACAEAQQRGRRAVYLPMAAVVGRLSQALDGQLDRQLEEQSDAVLVCIDGLEVIAGIADDETALFHFHNHAREAGICLIYAATAMPALLPFGLPDLISRLSQCTRLSLEPLNDDGRRKVLRQRAANRGLELDDSVLDYLFRRVGRDLITLTALLDQLDHASLAAQRRVTVPFLRGVLNQERLK